MDFEVLFGDDLSLKSVFYGHLNKEVKFDDNLRLETFPHKFLKNYAKDPRKGFFSRVNPGIIADFMENTRTVVVIHGYETFTAWIALVAAKLLFRSVIFRGEAVLEGEPYRPGIPQKLKKIILPIFFRLCDAVMYSCQGNKNYFKHFGVQEKKLFLLPCAVNNDDLLDRLSILKGQRHNIRGRLGIRQDHLVVLFSARFTTRKRPFDLIEAVRLTGRTDITILFVGDGPEKKAMEERVKECNINAVFTGFVGQEELAQYYYAADVNVVVSAKDPSPKALNEAMVFSLPIIVTDVVGTAFDLVKDNLNGFIVPVGDVSQIAEKIIYLSENPEERKRMGEVSRDIVDYWTLDAGASGLLEAVKYVRRRQMPLN